MPARLLAVSGTAYNRSPYLVQSPPPGTRYVTLSWCWGQDDFFKTTSANFASSLVGIPLNVLRQEFQDAVYITCQLDLDYIWIDAICIIQDDPADWTREALKMGGIYEHSYLTIAAATPRYHGSGIFRTRETVGHAITSHADHDDVFCRERPEHEYYTNRGVAGYGAKNYMKHQLADRAWCYQELKLSPRIIHYCATELVWECRTRLDCECGELTDECNLGNQTIAAPLQGNFSRFNAAELGAMWRDMVEDYTKRKLTIESDIFPALNGLAAHFNHTCLSDYMAGLWQKDLAHGLMWEHAEGSFAAQRPQQSRGPSWSWASVLGYVTFDHWWMSQKGVSKTGKQLFTFLNSNNRPWGSNRLGDTTSLLLDGVLLSVQIQGFQPTDSFGRPHCELKIGADGQTRPGRLDFACCEKSRVALLKETLVVFRVLRKHEAERNAEIGLLLQKVPGGLDTYRRIGTTRGGPCPQYDGLPQSEFTLV